MFLNRYRKINPCCRILLENFIINQLVKKVKTFMKITCSLHRSQIPTNGQDSGTVPSLSKLFLCNVNLNDILPSTSLSSKCSLSKKILYQNSIFIFFILPSYLHFQPFANCANLCRYVSKFLVMCHPMYAHLLQGRLGLIVTRGNYNI